MASKIPAGGVGTLTLHSSSETVRDGRAAVRVYWCTGKRLREAVDVSLPLSSTKNQGAAAMNISLTPHLERLVKTKVESGLYDSASEVMCEALRLLEERDQLDALRREAMRRGIGEATPLDMEAIKVRGRALPAERVFPLGFRHEKHEKLRFPPRLGCR